MQPLAVVVLPYSTSSFPSAFAEGSRAESIGFTLSQHSVRPTFSGFFMMISLYTSLTSYCILFRVKVGFVDERFRVQSLGVLGSLKPLNPLNTLKPP